MRSSIAVLGIIAIAALTGCSAYMSTNPYVTNTGGNGSGGAGGGPVGSVSVGLGGRIAFTSAHNGSINPAVDTIVAGSTVTWTWTGNEGISHSVQSVGSSTFASSAIFSADGQTYSAKFPTPGTYQYDCAVHGQAMRGTIVVR